MKLRLVIDKFLIIHSAYCHLCIYNVYFKRELFSRMATCTKFGSFFPKMQGKLLQTTEKMTTPSGNQPFPSYYFHIIFNNPVIVHNLKVIMLLKGILTIEQFFFIVYVQSLSSRCHLNLRPARMKF